MNRLLMILEVVVDCLLLEELGNTLNVKDGRFPFHLTFFHCSLIENNLGIISHLESSSNKLVLLVVLSRDEGDISDCLACHWHMESVSSDDFDQVLQVLSYAICCFSILRVEIDVGCSKWDSVISGMNPRDQIQKNIFSCEFISKTELLETGKEDLISVKGVKGELLHLRDKRVFDKSERLLEDGERVKGWEP